MATAMLHIESMNAFPSPIADSLNANIMANIPAPPSLKLPSYSAPQSRIATPPPPPKRRISASKPVSPIAKKVLSPIAKKLLSPLRGTSRSRHSFHATFAKAAAIDLRAPCPVHDYGGASQKSKLMRTASMGTFYKHNPRDASYADAPCPVSAYISAEQELMLSRRSESVASMNRYNPRAVEQEPSCPVHSYVSAEQEIAVLPSKFSARGVKFGDTPRRLSPRRPNCAVHVYSEAKSSLSRMGTATFTTGQTRRDLFQGTDRALAPVTSYSSPKSTLKTAGGVGFGSGAARSELPFPSHPLSSRAGLTLTTSARSRTSLAPRTLPKLQPLPEVPSHPAKAEGGGSPREIEDLLMA